MNQSAVHQPSTGAQHLQENPQRLSCVQSCEILDEASIKMCHVLERTRLESCCTPASYKTSHLHSHKWGICHTARTIKGRGWAKLQDDLWSLHKTQGRKPSREMHRLHPAEITILKCASISQRKWKRIVLSELCISLVRPVGNYWGRMKSGSPEK